MICSCYFIDPPPSISLARRVKISLFYHKHSGACSKDGAFKRNLFDTLWIKSNIVPWLNRHLSRHIYDLITFIHRKNNKIGLENSCDKAVLAERFGVQTRESTVYLLASLSKMPKGPNP